VYKNDNFLGNVTDPSIDVVSAGSNNQPRMDFLGTGATTVTDMLISDYANTPTGSNVIVSPVDSTTNTSLNVTFNNISQSGHTTLITSSSGPPPPSGFKLGTPPIYYDLQTTAVFDEALVCINYSGTSLDTNNPKESNLKLFHYENGGWTDQTTSLDTTNNIICASVTSFSQFAIFEPDEPPNVQINGPIQVEEGSNVEISAFGSDPEGSQITFVWDLDNDGSYESPGQSVTFSATNLDGPSSHIVRVQVTDEGGLTAINETVVEIVNVAPSVDYISAPIDPVQVNSLVSTSIDFTDPGVGDTHTAVWDWGDDTTSAGTVSNGVVLGEHEYTSAGVYTISVIVTDDDGGFAQQTYQYIVAFDPDGGFVTGGGWIDSPEGAYLDDIALTGKANFGFVSKYHNGAIIPEGETEFNFKMANLNFHSGSYEWLVVNQSGTNAQYKGEGLINGESAPNGDVYKFMLWAGDNSEDTFRIRIWYEENGNELDVYDNGFDQPLGAGNIKVHQN
jgi:hypothetical protein